MMVMGIIIAGPVAYDAGILLARAQARPDIHGTAEILEMSDASMKRIESKVEKMETSMDEILMELR